jgi:hypothetical protein
MCSVVLSSSQNNLFRNFNFFGGSAEQRAEFAMLGYTVVIPKDSFQNFNFFGDSVESSAEFDMLGYTVVIPIQFVPNFNF